RIRHLPVLDKGALVGIISIRDLTNWAVEEITGGHELPDLERSHTTLSSAAEINGNRGGGAGGASLPSAPRVKRSRGWSIQTSSVTSRGKSNPTVQSATIRTFRLMVGIIHR